MAYMQARPRAHHPPNPKSKHLPGSGPSSQSPGACSSRHSGPLLIPVGVWSHPPALPPASAGPPCEKYRSVSGKRPDASWESVLRGDGVGAQSSGLRMLEPQRNWGHLPGALGAGQSFSTLFTAWLMLKGRSFPLGSG